VSDDGECETETLESDITVAKTNSHGPSLQFFTNDGEKNRQE